MKTKTLDGMSYELAGNKKVNGKQAAIQYAESLGTPSLVWLVVKRHKVGLLMAGNVVLVLNTLVPEWPNFVRIIF